MRKRMVSLTLALVLCLSLIPVTAGAEESVPVAEVTIGDVTTTYSIGDQYKTAEAAFNAAWNDAQGQTATVRLLQSVTLSDGACITVSNSNSNIAFEMESHCLSGNFSGYASGLMNVTSGKLTIQGGTIKNTYQGNYGLYSTRGTVYLNNTTINAFSCVYLTGSSQVHIAGSTLTAKGKGVEATAGTVTISNTSIQTTNGAGVDISNATATISNSKITASCLSPSSGNNTMAVYAHGNATLTIQDSEVTANAKYMSGIRVDSGYHSVTRRGYASKVTIDKSTITATAGDNYAIFIQNFSPQNTKANEITITNSKIIASNTSLYFSDENSTINISNGMEIISKSTGISAFGGTVNISGGIISAGAPGKSSTNGVLVSFGGKVNISGDVEITVTGSGNQNCGVWTNSSNDVVNISGGTITVNPGIGIRVGAGTVNISGGTVNATGNYGLSLSTSTQTCTGQAILSGGTFSGTSGAIDTRSSTKPTVNSMLETGYAYYDVVEDTETLVTNTAQLESATLKGTQNTVRVKPAVLITSDPSDQDVAAGKTATFAVTAYGLGTLTYQWQVSEDQGVTWKALSSATNASYTTEATTTDMSGWQYRCVVKNTTFEATSNAATLTVHPKSSDTTVKKASVDNTNGMVDNEKRIITVELPHSTDPLPTESNKISITPTDSNAKISDLKTDNEGKTWSFTVTAEDGTSAQYTIQVTIAQAPQPTTYSVSVSASPEQGGTVTGAGDYVENASVTVTAVPHSGYRFTGWMEGGQTVSTDASYTFSITQSRTLTAQFVSSGSSSHASYYPVILDDTQQGTVTSSHTRARRGATVTLTVTPEAGYALTELTLTDKNSNPVPYTDQGNGTYTFSMPASPVTVTAVFSHDGGWLACPRDETCPIWPYPDASTTAWYHDAVHYCIDNGLMIGYPNGLFGPEDPITRGQFVTMLWRLAEEPTGYAPTAFADVAPAAYYAGPVAWAAACGVVTGYSDTAFGPNDPMTREQMAALLYRYARWQGLEEMTLPEDLSRFPDAGQSSPYAIPALQWAVGQGILQGFDTGHLLPQGTSTRTQAAQVLMNFLLAAG